MERIDCLVVGAGVIGLAIARALSLKGREVIVVEKGRSVGEGTSSRNSEVIHAGIHYPKGSLKARFCVEGRKALYEYCKARGIPHRRTEKLIVATSDDQIPMLDDVIRHANDNGVDDVEKIGRARVRDLEPALDAVAAINSPSTGIIDSHAYMMALWADAEANGASIVLQTEFLKGRLADDGVVAHLGGAEDFELHARLVVNAGGLHAHQVAASISGVDQKTIPRVAYAKGNYFGCSGKVPFSRLIYPVPEKGGLGVHLTLDMAGRARFGPDVEWIDELHYPVDPERAAPFYAAIRSYWPDLPDGTLYPDYAGIRVKLDGAPAADFRIEASHLPSLVNLYGIESPGLTSSLAIADHVASIVAAGPESLPLSRDDF